MTISFIKVNEATQTNNKSYFAMMLPADITNRPSLHLCNAGELHLTWFCYH